MAIQAIIFSRKFWNTELAEEWLKKHKYRPIKPVHITKNYYRYRLKDPKKLSGYRTKEIGIGIKLIIGY